VLRIPSTSKEYLKIPVTGADSDMPVEIAVVAATVEEPAAGDWKTAAWDGTDAKVLIGPGTSLALANGIYRVWVRITATPELPVVRGGLLKVT
jgi:hypothetical protein